MRCAENVSIFKMTIVIKESLIMGTGINIGCKNCKYNSAFMLGTGEYYVLVENCLDALPEESAEEISVLLKKHTMEDFTFAYKLFQCDHCTLLFDHGDLEIQFENQDTYLNPIACPSCHEDMRQTDQDEKQIDELICPLCSEEGTLELTAKMDWD